MDNFVAVDVETANNHPTSICAIAAVKVIDGCIVDRFYQLVKPEPEYYFRYFTEQVHGIDKKMTADSPTFDKIWSSFTEFVGNLPLVAHNKNFDEKCIRETCRCYRLDYPDFPFYCTLQAARRSLPRHMCKSRSLPDVCEALAIPFFNHHNALADAEGCAKIAMVIL